MQCCLLPGFSDDRTWNVSSCPVKHCCDRRNKRKFHVRHPKMSWLQRVVIWGLVGNDWFKLVSSFSASDLIMPHMTWFFGIPEDKKCLYLWSSKYIYFQCLSCRSALCSGNNEWSWVLCKVGSCISIIADFLSFCDPVLYFRRFTWVITVMEEHLRPQQGFSWEGELKGNLWVQVRAKKDSWLLKWEKYLKQQMLFLWIASCI